MGDAGVMGGAASTTTTLAKSPYTYFVYKESGTYKAKNGVDGAVNYSDTNADAVLASIIAAISPAGTPTIIELGTGDFNIAATFSAISSGRLGNITIRGQGIGVTNLVLQTSITGSNKGINVTGALGTAKNLTANLSEGIDQITVSTTDAATFTAGDFVLIRSQRLWDTSASASATGKQGEIHRVKAVNTGTGVISLYDRAFDSYATADTAAILKITMIQNITFEGFTVKPVSGSYTATGAFLNFYLVDNLTLKNIKMQDSVGTGASGIRLMSVTNSKLDVQIEQTGLVPFVELPSTGQYGIWVGCASQNIDINMMSRGPFRHPFTGGGSTPAGEEGIARGITITGFVSGSKSNAFDTHRDMESITFNKCTVIGASDGIDDYTASPDPVHLVSGITTRSKNTIISNCNLSHCSIGIAVSWEADDTVITGNTIHECQSFQDNTYGYGIRLNPASGGKGSLGTIITSNRIIDCGNNAIWGEGTNNDTLIQSNIIENCKQIKFTDSSNCQVIGNRFKNGANKALEMTGTSTGWTITSNDATGSAASTIVGTNIMRNNTNLGTSTTEPSADVAKTANYTLTASDAIVRADASGGAFTLTLPTAVGIAGQEYTIRRTDILSSTNLLTIATTSSQTIGGATAEFLTSGEYIKVESDGANWQVNARSTPSIYGYYFLKNSTNDRKYVAGLLSNAALIVSTTSPAANTLWAIPFIVAKTTKFDIISFSMGTAGACNARAGIYKDNGNLYPGALIFDTGSIDCSTGTVKNTTITAGLQVLSPGVYWTAWECDAATIQVRSLPNAPAGIGLLGCGSNMTAANSGYGYSVAHTFGALPDPYTSSATLLTTQPSVGAPVTAVGLRPI